MLTKQYLSKDCEWQAAPYALGKNLKVINSDGRHAAIMEEDIELLKKNIQLLDATIQAHGYSRVMERNFSCLLQDFFRKAEKFESQVGDEVLKKKIKRMFRFAIRPYLHQSVFMMHGLVKPRGYPGDREILEHMYDNVVRSKGVGLLFDKYFINNKYTKGVRYRKNKMRELLIKRIGEGMHSNLNILNLACGGCREIREILEIPSLSRRSKINFVLVDCDKETIGFVRKSIKRLNRKWNFEFYNNDVLKFLDECPNYYYDLIYSIGLADYLPNVVLGALIRKSFESLVISGCLVIAYKNTPVFLPTDVDWLCDWRFVVRSRSDVETLVYNYLETHRDCYKLTFFSVDKIIFFCKIIRKR